MNDKWKKETEARSLASMLALRKAMKQFNIKNAVSFHSSIEKAKRNETTSITRISDYQQVRGLSAEVCQKLNDQKPETIGQASRIPGITPAAISLLMVHLKKSTA